MEKNAHFIVVTGVLAIFLAASSVGAENARFRRFDAPLPGRYIVVFEDNVGKSERGALATQLARTHGGEILYQYDAVLNGFAVRLPEAAAIALSRNPNVQYVEEDYALTVASSHPTPRSASFYGIDRIDQHFGLDEIYTHVRRGAGVHVYVLDTGIRTTHEALGTRANDLSDSIGGSLANHGTFVAGVIGAKNHGVAKSAQLFSVRVCDNSGNCPSTAVVAGLNAIMQKVQAGYRPAVVNMSLSASISPTASQTAIESALNNAINAGITCVVAAGNGNTNVTAATPARSSNLITVAATDKFDNRASNSNFGAGVDVFAPGGLGVNGQFIPVPSAGSDTSTDGFSGTSAAAPHVAGIAALYLEANPNASHFEVRNAIVNNATPNAVFNPGLNTPNRMAYSLFVPAHPTNPLDEHAFYVRQQYLDWLRRMPDAHGFADWTAVLTGCGTDWACRNAGRVHIVRGFIESEEFRRTNPILLDPPTPHDYNREYARQLYIHMLQREPDQGGWDNWTIALDQTGDYTHVVGGFINSVEYWSRFGENQQQ